MKVVFPAPLGPMIAATRFGRNSPVTPANHTKPHLFLSNRLQNGTWIKWTYQTDIALACCNDTRMFPLFLWLSCSLMHLGECTGHSISVWHQHCRNQHGWQASSVAFLGRNQVCCWLFQASAFFPIKTNFYGTSPLKKYHTRKYEWINNCIYVYIYT